MTKRELANKVDFKTLDDFVATYAGALPNDFQKLPKEKRAELQSARYAKAVQCIRSDASQFPYAQVIVDEGQDCAIPHIEQSGIMDALKDTVVAKKNKTGNASSFFMFYDAFQLVSLRANDTAELPRVIREADCKLTLYKNCRNTHSIANAAASGILGDGRHPEMAVFNAQKGGLVDGCWVFHPCAVNRTWRDGSFYVKAVDFVVCHCENGARGEERAGTM